MAAEGGKAKPGTKSRMENFRKVRTSEEESPLPFPDLPPDVVEMKVKEGSKIRNLMNFAMAQMELKGRRQIVFSGCGRAVTKTITSSRVPAVTPMGARAGEGSCTSSLPVAMSQPSGRCFGPKLAGVTPSSSKLLQLHPLRSCQGY